MKKIYTVRLSEQQTQHLRQLVSTGRSAARTITRARILLLADVSEGKGRRDPEIARALQIGESTVERTRKRFATEGLDGAITAKKPARIYKRALDGSQEAHLIAMTCAAPPEGHKRWTLRLLATGMVEAGHADNLSHETVRQTLKKTSSSRG